MSVVEKVTYRPSKTNSQWTEVEKMAWIESKIFGFSYAIEVCIGSYASIQILCYCSNNNYLCRSLELIDIKRMCIKLMKDFCMF